MLKTTNFFSKLKCLKNNKMNSYMLKLELAKLIQM